MGGGEDGGKVGCSLLGAVYTKTDFFETAHFRKTRLKKQELANISTAKNRKKDRS